MSKTVIDSRWPDGFLQGQRLPSLGENDGEETPRRKPRRSRLLLWLLFFSTLLSMAWVGATAWSPVDILVGSWQNQSLLLVRSMILENGLNAFLFSFSLLGILTAHELGHYFVTRYYGIPSTPPIFIPFPFHAIGTCGALIAMEGGQADRKQMFDIGIAGPLAGLVVAIPILFAGILTDHAPNYAFETFKLGQPLLIQSLAEWLRPGMFENGPLVDNTKLNPFLMAAWAGLLVTGINMMPMSQLDGGHVAFGLLGHRSVAIAYAAFLGCIFFMIYRQQFWFSLMLGLVLLMGLRHPPSRNDDVPIGWARQIIGWMSLSLPILCIPVEPFYFQF